MSLGVEPGAEKFPAWALALESLGWLIRALGVIPAMAGIVVAFQHVQTEAFLMVLPSSIATASAAGLYRRHSDLGCGVGAPQNDATAMALVGENSPVGRRDILHQPSVGYLRSFVRRT